MQKILLYGIWGVYNYGCEAIVRGTVNNLKIIYPDASFYYASFEVEEDKRRLIGCDVEVIERPFRNNIVKRGVRKLFSYIKIDFPVYIDSFDIIDDFDIIVSIGGDMYTISSEGYYPYSLMKFGDKAIEKGKKYILWGGSIGPFDQYPKILKKFQSHLNNVTLIVSREYETIEYLKKIGIKKPVVFCPDPAFSVNSEKIRKSTIKKTNLTIGINLSPLSALFYTNDIEEAIALQSKTIADIIRRLNCTIILLPHVISDNIKDDDYRYLEQIYRNVSKEYPAKISIVRNDPGFIGIKVEILKCDVVLAARMHCAVNSITSLVPSIFLSYSKKSLGMGNLIYENDDFVIKLEEFTNSEIIIDKIEKINQLDILCFRDNVNRLKNNNSNLIEISKILKEE